MGETATVEQGDGDEAYVNHTECPWYRWHRKLDLLDEDQPGCDAWFSAVAGKISEELGARIRVETQQSLPAGDECCLRRIWVE